MIILNERAYPKSCTPSCCCANMALNGWFNLLRTNASGKPVIADPACAKRSENVPYWDDGEVMTLSNIYRRLFSQPVKPIRTL